MARNYEKGFSGLNRFVAGKREEEGKTKLSLRPPLHKLSTAEEVKKWIPSIQREIDYCLQQLSGVESRDYPEYKRDEFDERIQHLEREHKRFVDKVHLLDPSSRGTIPWQPRAYSRKRSHVRSCEGHMTSTPTEQSNSTQTQEPHPKLKKLSSPLVAKERDMTVAKAPASSPSHSQASRREIGREQKTYPSKSQTRGSTVSSTVQDLPNTSESVSTSALLWGGVEYSSSEEEETG